MTIVFIIVISLLLVGLILYYEVTGGYYGREIDKAFKDMDKGITTVITDEPNGSFSVEKYKDGKKL